MSYGDKVDHNKFNCSEEYESDYVASRYGANKAKVKDFLKQKCASGEVNNLSHSEVYALIKKELGLSQEVASTVTRRP